MWYLELLVYLLSIFTSASSVLPWSILTEDFTIEPECHLVRGFQFRLWGTACGYTWEELQDIHQSGYFAFVNIVTTTRIMNLVVSITGFCLMTYINFRGTKQGPLIMTSLMMGIITIISLSGYINEMQTTMTLPPEYLFIQGPGYMVYMASASVVGSIFFIEFFINFYSYNNCDGGGEGCSVCSYLAYLVSLSSVGGAFGELMRVDTCKDYVTPLDLNTCPESRVLPMSLVTIFGIFMCMGGFFMYITVKFFFEWTKINNGITLINLSLMVIVVGITFSFENFGGLSIGIYSIFSGMIFNIAFLLVYNHIIDISKISI
jgi:hypothetical protein